MRRFLTALALLATWSTPALAATSISISPGMTEPQFQQFSEDLGAALSYRDLTTASPLGAHRVTFGVGANSTNFAHAASWSAGTAGAGQHLTLPTLYLDKGLPFGLTIGGSYTAIPNSNIHLLGAEVSYSLFRGTRRLPAVAVRATYSRLTGVPELDFSTTGLEVALSKRFHQVTPYAGLGLLGVNSRPHVGGLSTQSFTENKAFAGAVFHLGRINVALEGDRIGASNSVTGKLGFRF